jgi:hypothetical protein
MLWCNPSHADLVVHSNHLHTAAPLPLVDGRASVCSRRSIANNKMTRADIFRDSAVERRLQVVVKPCEVVARTAGAPVRTNGLKDVVTTLFTC